MLAWLPEVSPAAQQRLIAAARKLVSFQASSVKAWLGLGNLLLEAGLPQEAAEILLEAAQRLASEPQLQLLLAEAQRQIGETDAAVAAADKACSLAPADQQTRLKQFDMLVATRCWERVAASFDRIASVAPARNSVIQAHAHFARSGDNPEILLNACEAALARQPGHTLALHHKAVALWMLGRDAEAKAVMGLDSLVSLAELPVHDDQNCGASLRDTLTSEILRNPTLVPDPHGKATRAGLQTRSLLQRGDKAVPALLEMIKSAVERYVDGLGPISHPFTAAAPSRVRLDAWAVVYPKDGRQNSHLHPAGWISGVTYVTAPRIARESSYRGPLVLGELDAERYPKPPPWGAREVEPVPGRIVLFPSFVPHATRPTGIPEQRVSIAFDVRPA